jgi:hypothetical protein
MNITPIESLKALVEARKKATPESWLHDQRTVYSLIHARWRKGAEQFKNRFFACMQEDAGSTFPDEAVNNASFCAAAANWTAEHAQSLIETYTAMEDALKGFIQAYDETYHHRRATFLNAIDPARIAYARATGESEKAIDDLSAHLEALAPKKEG